MATQIMISNGESILVDDEFHIPWTDLGKNWDANWIPNTVHAVIWNSQPGQNEIQSKDPATGMMTGNTSLSATSDAVGTTTVAALLTWAETRKLQIEEALMDFSTALADDAANGTTNTEGKDWTDYDPNYT